MGSIVVSLGGTTVSLVMVAWGLSLPQRNHPEQVAAAMMVMAVLWMSLGVLAGSTAVQSLPLKKSCRKKSEAALFTWLAVTFAVAAVAAGKYLAELVMFSFPAWQWLGLVAVLAAAVALLEYFE